MRDRPSIRLSLVLTVLVVLACQPSGTVAQEGEAPLPPCEWCGATEAPEDLGPEIRIAGPDEPGERLVITGTVYRPDGETPAPGVILYAYHTNAEGIYPKRGDETGNARRHGYLRGWLRTDESGRYRIETIRPASYPTGTEPAHVHMTVLEPGGEEYWIDSIEFEGDPLLTEAERRRSQGRGGSGIVDLRRDEDGTWHAERDVVLEP